MTPVLIEVGILLAVVAFLLYLAFDDRRNQRLRAEEDRVALEKARKSERQD